MRKRVTLEVGDQRRWPASVLITKVDRQQTKGDNSGGGTGGTGGGTGQTVPNPPCANGVTSLVETFSRTESGTWGTSEINSVEWSGGSNVSVNGSEGVIDTSAAFGGGQTYGLFGASLPVEISFDLKWDGIPSFLPSNFPGFFIRPDTNLSVGPFFTFLISSGPKISARLGANGSPSSTTYTTSVNTYAAGEYIHCRIRLESAMMFTKAWTGDEPAGWDGSKATSAVTPLYIFARSANTTSETGIKCYFDNITFAEGVVNPCPEIPPTAFYGRSYGPVLVAIADGVSSVFSLPYPTKYQSGTLEVTVNGINQPVTEVDPNTGTFTLGWIPLAGDEIVAAWTVPNA